MTLDKADSRPPDRASSPSGIIVFIVAALPTIAAIWAVPHFVTQDGPAHLYNAHILARSLGADSPFQEVFTARWEPLPNWAGHLTLMGLVSILPAPARVADRVMTTMTLLILPLAVLFLRTRVTGGGKGMPAAALLATLLAMNITWLLGFTSFLLGAALFPVTLGVWWSSRQVEHPWRRAGALAGLLTLGYFCHLISLGLAAFGLIILEAFTPGKRRLARSWTTALGLLPLGPLALMYLSLMRKGGGGLSPEWKHLNSLRSPRAWGKQLSWVDPVSIARRDVLPFVETTSKWFMLLTPVLWLSLAIVPLVAFAIARRRTLPAEHRGWWILAELLLIGGVLAPDTLGPTHGEYLQQRIVLLGLVALVPVLPFDGTRFRFQSRFAIVALTVALAIQTAFVWDYAFTSERTAGSIARVAGAVGSKQRIILMLSRIRTKFRANPLLHADGLLGIGTANILWNDYETRYYYFPVHFQDGLDHPDTVELEQIALSEEPGRAERWARLLRRHHENTDVVVVWGTDPELDAVTARWFKVTHQDGAVRVYRKSP